MMTIGTMPRVLSRFLPLPQNSWVQIGSLRLPNRRFGLVFGVSGLSRTGLVSDAGSETGLGRGRCGGCVAHSSPRTTLRPQAPRPAQEYPADAWRNGVGLCGDAIRQGIAKPTARPKRQPRFPGWVTGLLSSALGRRSHASQSPGAGAEPQQRSSTHEFCRRAGKNSDKVTVRRRENETDRCQRFGRWLSWAMLLVMVRTPG